MIRKLLRRLLGPPTGDIYIVIDWNRMHIAGTSTKQQGAELIRAEYAAGQAAMRTPGTRYGDEYQRIYNRTIIENHELQDKRPMTESKVRLWDHEFKHLATDVVLDTAIDDNGDQIEITIKGPTQIMAALVAEHQRRRSSEPATNLHITIDSDTADTRRGGIIREIATTADTLTLLITVHSHISTRQQQPEQPETIYPPRGYGIGLLRGGNDRDTIIGCWATEDEARQALADMRIVKLGDPR